MQLVKFKKRRIEACAFLFMAIFILSCSSFAGSILAIVDAKEIKNTGIMSGEVCNGEKGCYASHTYFIYEAKVKEILYGNLLTNTIIIANSQHTGYVKKEIGSWMILIEKIENKDFASKLGAQYVVTKSSFPEHIYCFDRKPESMIDSLFESSLVNTKNNYFCYSLDDMRENSPPAQ